MSFVFLLTLCVQAEAWIKLPQSRARLITDLSAAQPGQTIKVGLEIELDRGWHTYAENPGESGAPPKFEVLAPDQFEVGPIVFPPHETIRTGPITTYGYHDRVLLVRSVKLPASPLDEKTFNLQSQVEYLVCKDICVPAYTDFSIQIAYGNPTPSPYSKVFQSPTEKLSTVATDMSEWIYVMLWAFVGGLLLNLMPCVFPVLSIKALQMADLKSRYAHLFYAAGIIASLWILGGALVLLRASGEFVGWGFQLQSPAFVITIAFVFLLLALNLFGLFEFGERLQNIGSGMRVQRVWMSEFLSGVLTVLVAAPCSAPFMGAAIGFSIAQSPSTIFLTMTMLGFGLAFPFLIMYLFPSLHKIFPRPGNWMVTFKIVMGFPMLLTALWMTWILVGLKDYLTGYLLLGALISFAMFFYWASKTQRSVKYFAGALAFVSFIAPFYWVHREPNQNQLNWAPFTLESYQTARASQEVVFVDFTADWCLSCKVNERMTFSQDTVQKFIVDNKIKLIKADWTRRNEEITQILSQFNRVGVPFYLVFRGSREIILPEIITASTFIDQTQTFIKSTESAFKQEKK